MQVVKVVFATQTGSGRVVRTRRFTEDGYIIADNLTPKKTRILLMLALIRTDDSAEIHQWLIPACFASLVIFSQRQR